MPSPFPGMDPHLEESERWPGFHQHLAEGIVGQLNTRLSARYYADVQVRTVWEEVSVATARTAYPDITVLEPRVAEPAPALILEKPVGMSSPPPILRRIATPIRYQLLSVRVYELESKRLVTSIELLSPYNKRPGAGLEKYQRKRRRLLNSQVHLIEIDLLRGGRRPGPEVAEPPLETDYVLLVNRYQEEDERVSEIWPVALSEPFPLLPVPLLPPDPDNTLDLGAILQAVYISARYEMRINYGEPIPTPELRPAMSAWVGEHLPRVGVGA